MSVRRLTSAFAAAAITELLFLVCFILSPDASAGGIWIPNTFQIAYLYSHIPAKIIVEKLGCDTFNAFFVSGFITGTFQLFLVYWVAATIWAWAEKTD